MYQYVLDLYKLHHFLYLVFYQKCICLFQEIGYDSPRGGVSVVIEKAKWTTSHLLIQRATSKDSGIYKCAPLNAISATINLHVLRGTVFQYFYSFLQGARDLCCHLLLNTKMYFQVKILMPGKQVAITKEVAFGANLGPAL